MNELDLAREVQTLRARRRLSTSHPAAIDPDFAGVQLYDKSPSVHDLPPLPDTPSSVSSGASVPPPSTPTLDDGCPFDEETLSQCSPIFGSSKRERYLARRQMRQTQAAADPATPPPPPKGPSEGMWLSASMHPEVSPDEFRAFLKAQAERNVHHNLTAHQLDTPSRTRQPAILRRSSTLRRQVKAEESVPEMALHRHSMTEPESVHDRPIVRAESVPPRSPSYHSRVHRKPPPTFSHAMQPPLAPQPTPDTAPQGPRPPSNEHAFMRPILPPKDQLPEPPPKTVSVPPPRRVVPQVPEAAQPRPRPDEVRVAPRSSDDKGPRHTPKLDESPRASTMRDRKTFGLSWFSLTKEDDVRKKEAACDDEAPRREKDTFLTGLFSKRKGMDSYDSLRHRARSLFSGSSPFSHHTEYPLAKRYPVPVERSLYRLSHVKLSHPRRPLYQQVEISNFMFWYLSIIDSAQARPPRSLSSSSSQRGNGLSEYDEENQLRMPGTQPRTVHTGSLVPTAAASLEPVQYQGAPVVAWQEPASDPASHVQRPARGPLPTVPSQPSRKVPPSPTRRPVPRVARRTAHLENHLDELQKQALSTHYALRHPQGVPSHAPISLRSSHAHPLPLPPLSMPPAPRPSPYAP